MQEYLDYSQEEIAIRPWPSLEKLPDGSFRRVWSLTLEKDVSSQQELDCSCLLVNSDVDSYQAKNNLLGPDGNGFVVRFVKAESLNIIAIVTTRRDDRSDELFGVAYKMFESVSRRIAAIKAIQGVDVSLWRHGASKEFVF